MSEFVNQLKAEILFHQENLARMGFDWAKRVYEDAKRRLNAHSVKKAETDLNVKTGSLRASLKFSATIDSSGARYDIYFDEKIAPHAKFVVKGTRRIKPHLILETAVNDQGDLFGV